MQGYFGLQKAWDTGALAKRGISSILQCMLLRARVQNYGKTEENYLRDMESCVAVYLMLHVEDETFLQVWGNGKKYYPLRKTKKYKVLLHAKPSNTKGKTNI